MGTLAGVAEMLAAIERPIGGAVPKGGPKRRLSELASALANRG